MDARVDNLGDAITWAQSLGDNDFKWMLLLMAEDSPGLNKWQRKGMVNEIISRMGL